MRLRSPTCVITRFITAGASLTSSPGYGSRPWFSISIFQPLLQRSFGALQLVAIKLEHIIFSTMSNMRTSTKRTSQSSSNPRALHSSLPRICKRCFASHSRKRDVCDFVTFDFLNYKNGLAVKTKRAAHAQRRRSSLRTVLIS